MAVSSPVRLSEADRARARHHLGYPSIEPVSSIALGVPSASQPQFLLEISMDRLIPEIVGRVQNELAVLDSIECQQVESFRRMKFQQVAEVKLRNDNNEPHEHDLLDRAYEYWRKKLADDLGVPVNPFSAKSQAGMINIPVAHP